MKPTLRFTILAMIALPAVLNAQAVTTPQQGNRAALEQQFRERTARLTKQRLGLTDAQLGPARENECAICSAASRAGRAGAAKCGSSSTGDDGWKLREPAARERPARWGDTSPEAANSDSRDGAEGARRVSDSGPARALHRAPGAVQKARRGAFGPGWSASSSIASPTSVSNDRVDPQRQAPVEAVDFPPRINQPPCRRRGSIG